MTKRADAPKNKSHIKLGLSEASLRALLDADAERGALVVRRGNKISRRHYADKLGCSKSNLTRFIKVFSEYEEDYEVAARHAELVDEMVDDMKGWLTAAYEKRELQFRNGKILRLQFRQKFSISDGLFLERYPELKNICGNRRACASRGLTAPTQTGSAERGKKHVNPTLDDGAIGAHAPAVWNLYLSQNVRCCRQGLLPPPRRRRRWRCRSKFRLCWAGGLSGMPPCDGRGQQKRRRPE
jgi:hypothetical protein